MERGDRRLLHDLDLFGRIVEQRAPARERLRGELGAVTFQRLFAGSDSQADGTASVHRPRRVA
jgi:hypothetical protein